MSDSPAIWIEKYRPKDFSDIKGQDDVVSRVKNFVEKGNMPHLLFAGPAGVGKTSLALVIARKLFGEGWDSNFLELNASDERGIDVVREKVKNFARTRAIGDVPFKVIYLDESDALTKEAQQALRRTMENYTQTCRFILSCNYSSKIIDPIQSRCTVFRFNLLEKEDVYEIIEKVVEREGLSITEEAKEAVFEVSGGDCRRAENVLQSAASLGGEITEENIYSMASFAKPEELSQVIELCSDSNFETGKEKLLDLMLEYGLSGLDVVKQLQKEVWNSSFEDKKKLEMVKYCGEAEFRMVEGSDEYLQLEALIAKFCLLTEK